jgi:hypothetical protein
MRRLAAALVLVIAACRGERPAAPPATTSSAPATTTTIAAAPAPVVAAKKTLRSTPQQCAGDGSYEQALECIRMAARLKFTSSLGDGEMTRSTIGAEHMTVRAHDGTWTAEAKPAGIVWTHDGKHAASVPQPLEHLYQRLTVFPNPQKKEGSAKLAAHEAETNRYEFTDANNGDRYVVWVSTTDGRIVKVKVNELTIAFS